MNATSARDFKDWLAVLGRGARGLSIIPRSSQRRCCRRPKKLGVTHWSSRLLADHLGIGNAMIAWVRREYGVQPRKAETCKFSTDPELVGKVADAIGLYLARPDSAIVLCVNEKSRIPALDRRAPVLPMRTEDVEKRTQSYTPVTARQRSSRSWRSRQGR